MRPLTKVKSLVRSTQAPLGFAGGVNNTDPEEMVGANEAVDGRNMLLDRLGGAYNRSGATRVDQFLGSKTGILQIINHTDSTGTTDVLCVQDTVLYRDVSGVWTAVGSVTLTTNLNAESAYFAYLDKTYIVNGTDNVVKYTTGGTADQTDSSFKKGTGIVSFDNRLAVWGVSGQKNYLWVSDLGADTFGANSYVRLEGPIQKCVVLDYRTMLVITDRKVYKVPGFTSTPNAAGPEAVFEISAANSTLSYGTVAPRSVAVINKISYFLSTESQNTAEIVACNGQIVYPIGNLKIKSYLSNLNAAKLSQACAVKDGRFYRLAVTPSGDTINSREYLFDTISGLLSPYAAESGMVIPSYGTWQPEFRPGFGINCYCEIKSGGTSVIYAGDQSVGAVYKLNTNNYDELIDQQYGTPQNTTIPIDSLNSKRAAQGFKLSGTSLTSHTVSEVGLYLAYVSGTAAQLTVRIETDNNGTPSGTLANSNATTTIAAFSASTSFVWKIATFATTFSLPGSTQYWIVVKHTTEGSGNSLYNLGADNVTHSYSNGNAANYASTTSSTTVTYTPNADPGTTTMDGEVGLNTGGVTQYTFSNLQSTTTDTQYNYSYTNQSQLALYLQSTSTNNMWGGLSRIYLLFDTSSIPSDAVITSAKVSLYAYSLIADSFKTSFNIVSGSPASNVRLTPSDYALADFGTTRFTTDTTFASLTTGAFNDLTLNASGISAIAKAGITKFALRLAPDIDNTAPTWQLQQTSYMNFKSADAGIAYAPRLVVTYSTATGVFVWTGMATTDGLFSVYTQEPIESFVTQTSSLEAPQYRKKLQVIQVEGQSSTGITAYLGVGTDFKDSAFSDPITLSLSGKSSTWSSSITDTTTGHLVWANDTSDTSSNRQWASTVSTYSLSIFAGAYLAPARFVTFRFYYKGTGAFRINSYTPTFELIPTYL